MSNVRSIRNEQIYLSTEVWQALRVLARAERATRTSNSGATVTAAEVADRLLRKAIREKHPQLLEHQKRIDELEKKLIGDLVEEANIDRPETIDDTSANWTHD